MNSPFSIRGLFALILSGMMAVGSATPALAESAAERDARMAWFREARFGMFIHWGLYAIPAGDWNGFKSENNAEWIQSQAKVPAAEYAKLKEKFNPVKYNPEAWVSLAKHAGMKYIVITSKHHDGFCLWDSAHTDFDVASSPYGKDLLKPLAEACQRHGIRLCFYHSIMDWHHPDYGNKEAWRGNAENPQRDMDKYTAYMKSQLDELLTGYGPIGIAWFDGEWESSWTHERGKDLYGHLRSRYPALIINNRVDKGRKGMQGMTQADHFKGDYGTPEQEIPANGLPGVDWESCMTMNDTWGFSAHDKKWKDTDTIVRNLIDITSKGGNYLLNIGPTAEGEIPMPSLQCLQELGEWMKVNSESIHGTLASPFSGSFKWGRCTRRVLPDGNTRLYLHVFDWPADKRLELPGVSNDVIRAAHLAAADKVVPTNRENGKLVLTLPEQASSRHATVITLDLVGAANIQPLAIRPGTDGVLQLNAEDAKLDGNTLRIETRGKESNIGFWSNPAETIAFPVYFEKGGPHAVVFRWSCPDASAGSSIEVRLLDKDKQTVSSLPWKVAATGGWQNYKTEPIGVLAVPAAGTYTLKLVALDKKGEGVLNFATARLQPAEH
ncbi:MAG: alpha-L-fucosidase [Verrucomicrobiales bacterium]